MVARVIFKTFFHILLRESQSNSVLYNRFINLNIVVVIVEISILADSPIFSAVTHQIVHYYFVCLDYFLFHVFLFVSGFCFLFVGVFMVNSVVEILVVQFLVVTVKLTHSLVEANHQVFVLHQAGRLSDYFVGCLVSGLCVEGAKDHRSRGVIFEQRVFMRHDRTLGKLCI